MSPDAADAGPIGVTGTSDRAPVMMVASVAVTRRTRGVPTGIANWDKSNWDKSTTTWLCNMDWMDGMDGWNGWMDSLRLSLQLHMY